MRFWGKRGVVEFLRKEWSEHLGRWPLCTTVYMIGSAAGTINAWSAESDHPRLTNGEIISEEFQYQPM